MLLSMKTYFAAVVLGLVVLVSAGFPSAAEAAVRVKGYMRSNGTYVAPSYRSNPDSSRLNNWSTKGNYNPYTGKAGTRRY